MNSAPANDLVEELWARADSLFKSKSLDAAAEVAGQLAELLKDEPPGRISVFGRPIHGEVVGLLAYIAYLSNDVDRSDKLYDDALSELSRFPDTSRVPLGKTLVTRALSFMERNRRPEAQVALLEAIPLLTAAALNHEDAALDFLRVVADRASNIEDWKIAESALMAAIDSVQKTGQRRIDLFSYYGSLSTVRLNDRRAGDALEPARESLRLAREVGRPPKELAIAALNLATVHFSLTQYRDVLTLTREAVDLAPEDSEILFRARNLEGLAIWTNNPPEAIKALTEAVEIATRILGAHAKDTVKTREKLARLLTNLNRYREALPHWEFVMAVREYVFGPNSLEYADALNSYAVCVDQVGQYARADRLYRKALAISRRQLGEANPDVLILRYNLAEVARALGSRERAAREFRELEKTWRSIGHTESRGFVRVLLNFGITLTSLREFPEAREKLEEARAILAMHTSVQSPLYGRVLFRIAQLEYASRNYVTAISLFEQAAAVFRGREESIDTLEEAEFGAFCATIHVERTDVAVERAREQLAKAAERHDPQGSVIVERTRMLAVALFEVRRFRQSREMLEQIDTGARLELIEALKSEDEQNVRDAVQPMRDFQMVQLSLLLADDQRDGAGITKAYEMLIALRGAETTILRLRGRSFVHSSSSELQHQIQNLKKKIVGLELRGDAENVDAHVAADLQAYRDQLRRVESELVDRVGDFRLDMDFLPPALGIIAQALGSDTALVEFASYRRLNMELDNPLDGPDQYAAFVVRGGAERVQLFELGPASEIDRLIEEFREAVITQPRRRVNAGEILGWKAPGNALTRQIIEPIREAIAGVKKLVIVPEGKISLVPLGALPTENGFLIDDLEISYRFTSRNIRRFSYEEEWGVGGPAVVIGAPDYDLQTGAQRSDPLDDDDFLSQFRSGQRFDPLQEAAAECSDIARLLEIEPLLARDATETAVKTVNSPEVLHLSTHGFVLEHITSAQPNGQNLAANRARLENSLDRSGLALAGANAFLSGAELPADAEDGILYAGEVTGINLMRTDVVTLSACQTGLGDVLSGDGVHGLQRAFTAAGARTVVCSLWEVPDKPTRTLFTRFYEEIFVKKRPRGEALRDVIRELAREYPLNPIAWGGFVLCGDDDVLTRHHPVRSLNLASAVLDNRKPPRKSPAQKVEERIAEGRRLMRGGDAAGALKILDGALEIRPVPDVLRARVLYERAEMLRLSGELKQALEAYDALAEMRNLPERLRVEIEINRGTAFQMEGKLEEAIESYSAGLAFAGLDLSWRASVMVNRGIAYWELHHQDEAIADLNTVIETPGMPREQRVKAILTRAEIYLTIGRYEEAETEVNKAHSLDLTPDETAAAMLVVGQVWAAQNRIDDAITNFQSVLGMDDVHERYHEMASTLLTHFTAK